VRRAERLDEGDRPDLGAEGDGESDPLEGASRNGSIYHARDMAQYLGQGNSGLEYEFERESIAEAAEDQAKSEIGVTP
jgi:hypothetical protein